MNKYKTKSTPISKDGFSYLNVEIFIDRSLSWQNDIKIGEYERNYYCMYDTFFPFEQNGKEYALYSLDYTATRVMELPSCKDICGEEGDSIGFCPVEFYVSPDNSNIGFVSGCVWGDDSSWKVQVLDLSKISEGIFKREDKLEYAELAFNQTLKEAISSHESGFFINLMHRYKWDLNHSEVIIDMLGCGKTNLDVWDHLEKKYCRTCGMIKEKRKFFKEDEIDPFACQGHS